MKTGGIKKKAAYFFSNIVMQGMFRSQPWPSIRIKEMLEWSGTPIARDLLDGKLPQPKDVDQAQEKGKRGFLRCWGDSVVSASKSLMFWDKGDPT